MDTLLDQILASRGVSFAPDADSLALSVDHIYGHDRNTFKIIAECGGESADVWDKLLAVRKLRLFMDHYSPAPTLETSELHLQQRRLARRHGLPVYDEGTGVGHQIAVEEIVGGGDVVLGVDTHTCTVGALGSLGIRQPPIIVAKALSDGRFRFDRPESVRVELIGRLPQLSTASDIGFTLGRLGSQPFEDCVLEFGGAGLRSLRMSDRFTLANLAADLHARSAICETDERTRTYLDHWGRGNTFLHLQSDVSAYEKVVSLDLSAVQPIVVPPPTIFDAIPVPGMLPRLRVDVVALGTCTAGRYEDFQDFLMTFGQGPVATNLRLTITPPSRPVFELLLAGGAVAHLAAAGATFNPPGCGPCMGLHQGVLADGEVCLITGSRNSPGRMGSKASQVYLSGPKVAGATARCGYITI